jgi:phosphatidylserine/phosphatidylglycerophosphate/cardiolipin synthase-like enzyme
LETQLLSIDYLRALTALLRRGQVRFDLSSYLISPPHSSSSNDFLAFWAEVNSFKKKGGKVRFLYDGGTGNKLITQAAANIFKYCHAHDIQCRALFMPAKLHAKFWILDNAVSCIGSHNLTVRGSSSIYELSTIFFDADLAASLSTHYESIWRIARENMAAKYPA